MSSLATPSSPAPPSIGSCTIPTVLNIKGDSYRLKEKRQAGLFQNQHLPPNPKPTTKKPKT